MAGTDRPAAGGEGEPRGLEVRLLGSFEASGPGGLLELARRKERLLLAALALRAGEYVPFASLVDELWDDELPDGALTALRTLVSRLRRALGRAGAEPVIGTRRGLGYRLEVGRDDVDVLRFERLLGEGRRAGTEGASQRAAATLEAALRLWRGPPLEEFSDHAFARAEAGRLDELRLEATERLAEALLEVGRETEALALVQGHVADHRYREQAWGLLMVCLYRLGRQADALRAFQELREDLARDLGIEPSPGLRDLERRVLLQSPDLERAPVGGRMATSWQRS